MTAPVLVGRFRHQSPEWHAARRGALGGSEVAAALGLSPWCSPFTLWHRKTGRLPEQAATMSMDWGTRLEPIILDRWLEDRSVEGMWPVRNGTYKRDGWKVANPDLMVGDRLVEAKTDDGNHSWAWGPHGSDDPDAVPLYYRIQCLWYGHVMGTEDLTLAVLIGGNDYREIRVPWDPIEVDLIVERAAAFWQTVLADERPDLDSSSSTYSTVRAINPDIDRDAEVELPADLINGWRDVDAAKKSADAVLTVYRTEIADLMGDARYGLVAGERAVIRQANGGGAPYPKLIQQPRVRKASTVT